MFKIYKLIQKYIFELTSLNLDKYLIMLLIVPILYKNSNPTYLKIANFLFELRLTMQV